MKRHLLSVRTSAVILLFTFVGVSVARAAEFDQAKLSAIAPRMQQFVDEGVVSGVVAVVGNAQGVVQLDAVGLQDLEAKQPMPRDA
ncbi:MAG TPA: hypothetical protein VFV87_06340, partial [Pirellulaceae bacterium]|nr:hypothetical protein [Pirellulaceae bacterium]